MRQRIVEKVKKINKWINKKEEEERNRIGAESGSPPPAMQLSLWLSIQFPRRAKEKKKDEAIFSFDCIDYNKWKLADTVALLMMD